MSNHQREQNPDVNSYAPDVPDSEGTETGNGSDNRTDIERNRTEDVIPVPPDAQPAAPVEEPPGTQRAPVGDVDDSPKKIA